jgi:hypothetical protein
VYLFPKIDSKFFSSKRIQIKSTVAINSGGIKNVESVPNKKAEPSKIRVIPR